MGVPIVLAPLEHVLDVGVCVAELDRIELETRPAPALDVLRTGVVGGERRDLVALEPLQQVVEIERAVADVEVRVGEVLVDERLSSAQLLDRVRGGGRDLHQPSRAGLGGLVGKAGLLVDDRRDEGRVQVEAGGLLADDVVVAQRQPDLVDGLLDVEAADCQRRSGHGHQADDHQQPVAGHAALPAATSESSLRSSSSSSASEPSLRTT
jgi:hypothetical protein